MDLTSIKSDFQLKREELLNRLKPTLEGVSQEDLADDVDHASCEYAIGMQHELRNRDINLLKRLEIALQKIETEEYGICEDCGEEIAEARLRIVPDAQFCVMCAEEHQRKSVTNKKNMRKAARCHAEDSE